MAFAMTALSQTAFAKTYVITDGDRVASYTTFATDPQEVLNEMGLTLERKDKRNCIVIKRVTYYRYHTGKLPSIELNSDVFSFIYLHYYLYCSHHHPQILVEQMLSVQTWDSIK